MQECIIHTSKGIFLFVEVPMALDYRVIGNVLEWIIPHLIWSGNPPEPSHEEIEDGEMTLPPGSYSLIGISDAITEEQADMIVDRADYPKSNLYKFYYKEPDEDGQTWIPIGTALGSFRSLLSKHSLDTHKYAILKTVQ